MNNEYPIFKVNFKTDNTNSLANITTEGITEGLYKSLGLVVENGKIKIEKTKDDEKQTLAIADSNTLANTWYTAEFEYSPTGIKTYVYKQGDPKPALPAYTYTETAWDPNILFTSYQGNAYIDNVDVKTVQDTGNYVYDNLNRLTEVKDAENEVQTAYTYDEQGNRLTKITSAGTTNYQYSVANELLSTTVDGQPSTTYTYDQNGNTATKVDSSGTTTYTYDNKNQLVKVVKPNNDIIEYTYDGNGNRYW